MCAKTLNPIVLVYLGSVALGGLFLVIFRKFCVSCPFESLFGLGLFGFPRRSRRSSLGFRVEGLFALVLR